MQLAVIRTQQRAIASFLLPALQAMYEKPTQLTLETALGQIEEARSLLNELLDAAATEE